MIPRTFAVGQKYTYFLADLQTFFENNKIEEGTSLYSTNDSIDLYDYHLSKSGECAFKTMECNQTHSFYRNEGAEEDNE